MTLNEQPDSNAGELSHLSATSEHVRATAACHTAVVIEGDAHVRALLTQTLESAGYATDAYSSGEDGAQAALATSPDLVTVGINLAGIDGIEVTRRIRAASQSSHIIIISAHQDEVDTLLGFTAGADDYVTKPFLPRVLRARIDAVSRRLNRLTEHQAHGAR